MSATEGGSSSARIEDLMHAARRTRGFMPDDEGLALFEAALRAGQADVPAAKPTTFVEIGAWCGKSTVYLGAAAEASGAVLLSVLVAGTTVRYLVRLENTAVAQYEGSLKADAAFPAVDRKFRMDGPRRMRRLKLLASNAPSFMSY